MIDERNNDPKFQFAIGFLRNPDDAYPTAARLANGDTRMALWMTTNWPRDPDVQRHMADLLAEQGPMAFLPQKHEVARKLWKMTDDVKMTPSERLSTLRLYSDVMGYIQKEQINNNVNVINSDKVMIVENHGNADSWEQRMFEQQTKLVSDATARIQ